MGKELFTHDPFALQTHTSLYMISQPARYYGKSFNKLGKDLALFNCSCFNIEGLLMPCRRSRRDLPNICQRLKKESGKCEEAHRDYICRYETDRV